LLAQLVARWTPLVRAEKGTPLIANTPAAALSLADDLARLIDDVITRQMDWQKLDRLVPDRFDEYWQQTLKFLKIARNYWPERLKEIGSIDAAERRDQLINAEMRRLADSERAGDCRRVNGFDAGNRKAARCESRSCRAVRWCSLVSIPISTKFHGAPSPATKVRRSLRPLSIRSSPCMPCSSGSALRAMPCSS
jgi:hypothetical protein